jgi:transcriptional regulator with GAF, ATPase, and Fis domain
VLATAIHGWSRRANRPLVSINCAALPEGLAESEFFGHVRGAFTGATGTRIGRFQAANGGTLFLDEVGQIPVSLQGKLLRALQEGCFEPVGSDRTVRVDVRIVAATNLDLQAACARGAFREDLYYRLAVFPIHLPPLRSRKDDIPGIARNFLESLARRTGRGPWMLTQGNLAELAAKDWPGNVRELVNTLERATILADGRGLEFDGASVGAADALEDPDTAASLEAPASGVSGGPEGDGDDGARPFPTLRELERDHFVRALRATNGKLYGPEGAARLLGMNPSTLQSRMRKLGLGGAREFRARRRDT